MSELTTHTITSNVDIGHEDKDLFGLRSLHTKHHPLSEERFLDSVFAWLREAFLTDPWEQNASYYLTPSY